MRSIVVLASSLLLAGALHAQDSQDTTGVKPAPKKTIKRDTTVVLETVRVGAKKIAKPTNIPTLQAYTLPATAIINAEKAAETVNIVDAEDAVKYQPSVFMRKRNSGDTQATMGTRTWGTSSSARSLIFADGVPLTALVANNNTIGGPRWGLVSPAEIERIDMMFGPFSAAYGGNAMGAVMEITTRLPQKLEASISQTGGVQTFDLYGTKNNYGTSQTTADLGDRFGKFSFWVSGNYANSFSQPLSYATAARFPTGVTGGFAEKNKLGADANVLGATGLLHTKMTNGKLKMAYDITKTLRAAYTFGMWQNDANSGADVYTLASGQPTYAGQAGFASGTYGLDEKHSSHSLTLRTDRKSDWDFEAVGTTYRFDKDKQNSPTTASATGTSFGLPGRVAVLDGTGWQTLDFKGVWHRGGPGAKHNVSFGAHHDDYKLLNTTFNTPDWRQATQYSSVFTEGDGKTRTEALWAQDSWYVLPQLRFTYGLRGERWKAFDGYNVNGNTKINQPEVSAVRYSPKGSLAWFATEKTTVNASVGKAYRFATAAELYQLVSTGTTFTSPDPNLKPDNVTAAEVRYAHRFSEGASQGNVQVALFQDDIHDAIISQFKPLVAGSPLLYSFISNVDHVRSRGVEFSAQKNNVLLDGLELAASYTFVNARTLATSGAAGATSTSGSPIGKRLPNIPARRYNFTSTYRPDDKLAFTVAGRYASKVYTTLDNADINPNTYQGFAPWFVADARVNYKVDRHMTASLGVDNLNNRKYFLFHPFPQRTFVGSLKLTY